MRALIAAAALAASGCATTWIATQGAGVARVWDEGVNEATVPLPGVDERLNVTLPLAIEYTATATPAPGAPASVAEPFALTCSTDQRARDVVYHSAFRYGKRWKTMSGVMALVEGALATAFLLSRDQKPEYVVYGGFFGIDAAITAALFFIPRKEIYRTEEQPSVTHVRSDCPEGMVLAIGADQFPVDAAGRIGEVGEVALDAWMSEPTGPLQLSVAGQVRRLEIGPGEQCMWRRDHHRDQPSNCYVGVALRSILTSIEVAPGTLTGIAALRDARDAQRP
jgi:hypothetical protein